MSKFFEEIDAQDTSQGELTLRRRRIPALGDRDIYEVKLGEDYLMSSMFVDAEVALADLGLKALAGEELTVVVGGLGLGYTAEAALRDQRVSELLVVDAFEPVIRWHKEGKVPLGPILAGDSRCRFVHADFFKVAVTAFDAEQPARKYDAVLLDIDHSPRTHLHRDNESFYTIDNLTRMAEQLMPDGVFALWSNEPADEAFTNDLKQVFESATTEEITFWNPFQDAMAANTVYVAKHPRKS
jgi:spermidine synthase